MADNLIIEPKRIVSEWTTRTFPDEFKQRPDCHEATDEQEDETVYGCQLNDEGDVER